MSVREFDATDDFIVCDNGAIGAINNEGGYTYLLLVKPNNIPATNNACYISLEKNTTTALGAVYQSNAGSTVYMGEDEPAGLDQSMAAAVTADEWQLLVVTKAAGAGSTAPRGHRKLLTGGSWTHVNSGTTQGTTASSVTAVTFGAFFSPGSVGFMDARIAVAAIFDYELSDSEIESIGTKLDTARIDALGPIAGWEFNQAAVGTNVTDWTGGGADQTARTGTTVIGGDDPPGWTFGPIGVPISLGVAFTSSNAADAIATTATTPAGALLVAVIHAIDADIPSNYSWVVSGGGLTWQQDAFLEDVAHGTTRSTCFWSAPAPSGLASATDITITPTNNAWGWHCELLYIEGVDLTAGRVDVATAHAHNNAPSVWSTGSSVAITATNAVMIGGAMSDGALVGENILTDSPATELSQQFGASNTWLSSASYRITSSAASYTMTGTLSDPVDWGVQAAWIAYKAAVPEEPPVWPPDGSDNALQKLNIVTMSGSRLG